LNRTVPEDGLTSPESVFTRVLLPAPLGPMTDTNSPSLTVRPRSRSTGTSRYPAFTS